MQFEVSTLDGGIVRVTIGGRLDMDAAIKLENPFTFQVSTVKAPVVVDMTAVEFIASIAMRLLLKNAKAQQGRGGRLVLYNPTTTVREALTIAGIATIIPMYDDFDAACRTRSRERLPESGPALQHVLTLRNTVAELARLGEWVGELSADAGIAERDRFRVDLALCEAVTNIILNAYSEGGRRATSPLSRTGRRPSSPSSSPTRDARSIPWPCPRGYSRHGLRTRSRAVWGILLIRRLCDESRYERAGGPKPPDPGFSHASRGRRDVRLALGAPMDLALYQSHRLLMEIPGPRAGGLDRAL